jgi:hypothetical protein
MTASSTQGVGHGSVQGYDAGSKHVTQSVSRLIGPRVMVCDTATLATGTATVKLPKLSGSVGDYAVFVSDASGTAAATSGTMSFGTNDTTVTLKGTSTNVVNWSIVKQGLAL